MNSYYTSLSKIIEKNNMVQVFSRQFKFLLFYITRRHDKLKNLLSNVSNDEIYNDCVKFFFEFEDRVRIGENNLTAYCDNTSELNSKHFMRQKRNKNLTYDPLSHSRFKIPQKDLVNEAKRKSREKLIRKLLKHYKNDEDIYEHYLQKFIQIEVDYVILRKKL